MTTRVRDRTKQVDQFVCLQGKKWKRDKTSENKKKTGMTTRVEKSTEAAIKQIVTQKIQATKIKMQEWKQIVIQ